MVKNTSFKRNENKFVVLEKSYVEIYKTLEKRLKVDSFKENCIITLIRSIYLDNDDFSLFREYLNKRKFRYKIRFRSYGYDFKLDESKIWAEIKIKHKKISAKERFLISKELFEPFLKGENVKNEIMKLNNNSDIVSKSYDVISELIKMNNLKPVLTTTYERVAFQNQSTNVRITVDRNIVHQAYNNDKTKKNLHVIVCETKILGNPPIWYFELVNELSLLPQQRFSKYATGINTIYFPERGTYNFYSNFAEEKKISTEMRNSLDQIKKILQINK